LVSYKINEKRDFKIENKILAIDLADRTIALTQKDAVLDTTDWTDLRSFFGAKKAFKI
jgi:hypothetical protein